MCGSNKDMCVFDSNECSQFGTRYTFAIDRNTLSDEKSVISVGPFLYLINTEHCSSNWFHAAFAVAMTEEP